MSELLDIHGYADGQLDKEEAAKVEEKLKTCQKSQAELRAVRELKALVAEKCDSIDCSTTWASSRKRLDEIDRTKRVEGFVGRYAWGICAIFMVVIMSAAIFNRSIGGGIRTGDVARISASMSPVLGPSSQAPDERERWLRGLVQQDGVPVPQTEVVQVTGGAVGRMDGKKIVRLNLQDGHGDMALFILPDVNHVDDVQQMQGQGMYSAGKINDMNCIAWTDSGNAYLMIGDRTPQELARTADTMFQR